ncbi:M48 family metallopeptidase [Sulfurovum sp. bin170]|uniref:M48 family metallopeptidase n=1 Tax=Sulfurovum sp. bin170 TaxID=2695268 RepID=UPI0013DEF833|nr:M48 family metallopeptidase [Sulfurovum sp. bin170]NEW61357.1 M48 family metallopeptidase [Sulfurovum sp. bin170]
MKFIKKITLIAILALLFIGCTKAPITGRSQLIMMNPQEEMKLGYASAKQILSKEKISTDRKKNAMVKRVGQKIAKVTEREYKTNFKWEFFVIENAKQANAFCLPGGKVFVYTGLFKYVANDDELAAVIGHEIGHALARHGAERMSRGQLAQASGQVLNAVMIGQGSPQNTAMVMQAFGVGTQLGVMLPHSRDQELEADHIGIVLAAKAGYRASAALTFWDKFAKSGETPPEYLSTHPAPKNRIIKIREIIKKKRLR